MIKNKYLNTSIMLGGAKNKTDKYAAVASTQGNGSLMKSRN